MFEDFDFNTEINNDKSSETNKNYNKNFNKNYKNYTKSKKNVNKYGNAIRGGYTIDIWNQDPNKFTVKTLEYNPEEVKESKIITFANYIRNGEIEDDKKEAILEVMKKLADKGYKARIICDLAQPLTDGIVKIFGKYNVYFITPWKNYCKSVDKSLTLYMPTDENIALAANYFKGYHKLPGTIKAMLAAVITTVVGLRNNEPSTFILTYDPFYKGKEIDFKNSKDTANYYIIAKKLGLAVFNLYHKDAYETLKNMLKDS